MHWLILSRGHLFPFKWKDWFNFGWGPHEEQFFGTIFEFGSVVQEVLFKHMSDLDLWRPLHPAKHNHLCNFGRSHHEEQFFGTILNLDQRFRRCCLNICLI